MRKDWEVKKLGDIATYVNGYAFKPNQWSDKGLPIIRIQNLNDNDAQYNYCDNDNIPSRYLVNKGDILISWSASLGVYEWLKNTAYLNQHIFKVVFDKLEINKYYFKYAVSSKIDHMVRNAHGATMKHIVKKDFDNTPIYYPPLQIQQQIVEELNCLTSIIEKQKKQLEELDNLAQAIFYNMFGNPIVNEKGWAKTSFGKEFKISSGGTPDTKNHNYWNNGSISWIGSNLCQDSILYCNDGKFITEEGLLNSSAKLYSSGYVLVALVGATIGKVAMLKFSTTTNQNIAGIDVNSNQQYTPEFTFYLLQTLYPLFLQFGGDKFKMANLSFIRALPLITPPLSLQQQFTSKIEAIEKQKELIKKSIKETEDLFNSRMDYYFN